MRYSLWSRGRLLGHSDLVAWAGRADDDGFRCGFLECSEGVESLIEIVAAVEKAELALDDAPDDKTAAADLVAARDRAAALELEIRDSDGRILKTSEITLGDTLHLASRVDRPFDDAEAIEELNEDFDLEDDVFEREAFEQQLETELRNTTRLDSFDDDMACVADDDRLRYMLSVWFVNPEDLRPARFE